MAKRTYINESHQKYEEACLKEVEEMSKHPLSAEEFDRQSEMLQEAYRKRVTQEFKK